jgi:hypothetical protein
MAARVAAVGTVVVMAHVYAKRRYDKAVVAYNDALARYWASLERKDDDRRPHARRDLGRADAEMRRASRLAWWVA